jgi:hypothetical protein
MEWDGKGERLSLLFPLFCLLCSNYKIVEERRIAVRFEPMSLFWIFVFNLELYMSVIHVMSFKA